MTEAANDLPADRAGEPQVAPTKPIADDSAFGVEAEIVHPRKRHGLTVVGGQTLYDLAARDLPLDDPGLLAERMETFLTRFDALFFKRLQPESLVRYTDNDGNSVFRPDFQASLELSKIWGISVYNVLPLDGRGIPCPEITEIKPGVFEAEIWGSGHCARTGEVVEFVRASRRSSEKFIGRGTIKASGGRVHEDSMMSDLKDATYTLLRKKIYLMLSGKSKLTARQLVEHKVDMTLTKSGHGGGTRAQRDQEKTVSGGGKITPKQKSRVWALGYAAARRLGMDDEGAEDIVRECLKTCGVEKTEELTPEDYRKICKNLEGMQPRETDPRD